MATYLPFGHEASHDDKPCGCLSPAAVWQLLNQPLHNEEEGGTGGESAREELLKNQKEYTDEDFSRDMQRLTFQERQHVTEGMHLVADQVEETEEFVKAKIDRMMEVLEHQSRVIVQRDAWDRAVFLRPFLAVDRDHYLMFLRAKDYDPFNAAMILLQFYEGKAKVYGDELLARRICWDDLTVKSRHAYQQAYVMYLPRNRESPTRQVWYNRANIMDPNLDPMDFMRAILYPFFCNVVGNADLQRKGTITIIDMRGPRKRSPMKALKDTQILSPMMDTLPFRVAALHFLLEPNGLLTLARSIQSVLSRDRRIRVRLHVGSWMEIQYSLRSFGIDIEADWLDSDEQSNPFSQDAIQAASQEYLRTEETWKRSEAPYCDPTSPVALFPNSQDIIMGKNRKVAASWPGNLAYTLLIQQQAVRYGAASTSKAEKMNIVRETLQCLKSMHGARFLTRKDNVGWDALSDEDARAKISQSLRDETRKLSKRT